MFSSLCFPAKERNKDNVVLSEFRREYTDSSVILGSGAYATVTKGFNKRTNLPVAIKTVVKKNLPKSSIRGIRQEIKILGNLSHRNIVKLYDSYETSDCFILVMEFLAGGDLYDRVTSDNNVFTEGELRKIVIGLVKGLKYARDKGIVHRDIKPQNIMFTESGEAKLVDFNLSFEMDPEVVNFNLMETQCGTPAYVAPEVISGNAYNAKCDVWSLGVIIYVMASGGFVPFYSEEEGYEGDYEVLEAVKKGRWCFAPANVWLEVSSSLKDLIKKMIVKKVEQRYCYEDILNHSWLKDSVQNSLLQVNNEIENRKTLEVRRKLKAVATTYLALSIFQDLMKPGPSEAVSSNFDTSIFFENEL